MRPLRRLELISGILTGLLALAVSCTLAPPQSIVEFFRLLAFYLVPALLVAVGSYVHAVRGQRWGFVILLVGGVILAGIGFIVTLFGGLFYFYGLWRGLLRLAPSTMAILTMIASLFALSNNQKEELIFNNSLKET